MNKFKFEQIRDFRCEVYGYELLYSDVESLEFSNNTLSNEEQNQLLIEQFNLLTCDEFWMHSSLIRTENIINIFVNIEPFQLNNEELVEEILSYINDLNRLGVFICLEITERVDGTQFNEITCKNIKVLFKRGVKIAIDDYEINENTWRSSVLAFFSSYISFVKINIDSFNALPTIQYCCDNEISIILERVESENDLDKARSFLCYKPFFQGYIFK